MIHHNPDQGTVVNKSFQSLSAAHYREIVERRGIDAEWAKANCKSVDESHATGSLGYTAKSPGIMFIGEGSQRQFKPDVPWASQDGKKPKYRTPGGKGGYDVWLPKHPTNRDYWSLENLKKCLYILITEGCFKAIAGCSNGIPTISLLGVTMGLKPESGELVDTLQKFADAGIKFIIAFDSDAATNLNVKKAEKKLCYALRNAGATCYSATGLWQETEGKGMDDFIQNNGIEAFRDILEKAYALGVNECEKASDSIPDTAPAAEDNYILKAESALYSDGHWVSIGGVLYRFTGSHYEEAGEAKEKRRIGNWLKAYSEKVKGVWVKNRADTNSANAVFNWVLNQTAIDTSEVNPGGLNCTNGVIKINPDGSHSLVSHNPSQVYTYVGCKYDTDIDSAPCVRLLECLEPAQREIFLKTIAAALNLKLVRSKLGRGVKGLLCYGEGSNGKDTLRAAFAAVLGRGMTGKTLGDFKAYDGGRKFTLSGLEGSLCNWASENTSDVTLDKLQSLKQFITGDPLDIERKGKDAYEFKPQAIFLANCNKLPSITGGIAAIEGRYGILSFKKTYKRGADANNDELEADPRFKDDENFILEEIAPALLNMMLERLPSLLTDGIDYRSTREAMQEAQEESRHLWQFVNEVGIIPQSGGRIYINDLMDVLNSWYQEQGILEIEYVSAGKDKYKEKYVWSELPDKYDKPVKAAQQAHPRLKEIFPKVEKHRHTEGGASDPRKGQRYLSGIAFVKSSEVTEKSSSLSSLPFPERVSSSLPSSLPSSLSEKSSSLSGLCKIASDDESDISDEVSDEASDEETLTQSASDESDEDFVIAVESEYSAEEQRLLSICRTPEDRAIVKGYLEELRAKNSHSAPEPSLNPSQQTEPKRLAEQVRQALKERDVTMVQGLVKAINVDPVLARQVQGALTKEENANILGIIKTGLLLGMKVRYIGTKYADQYGGYDLIVHSIDCDKYGRHEITCEPPVGSLTTGLFVEELERIK